MRTGLDASTWAETCSRGPVSQSFPSAFHEHTFNGDGGMLHQYSDPPFTDLGNHYSAQLNSCSSFLLNQSRAETPEGNDSDTYPGEGNEFLQKEIECTDEYSVSSFDVESVVAMGKHIVSSSSDCCEAAFEDADVGANAEIIKDEQNNNCIIPQPVEDKDEKSESPRENVEVVPSDDTTTVEAQNQDDQPQPAHKNDDESKESVLIASNADTTAACELCDENESTFRLPGFRQAFGSTEIGRFVHQKDFIEQINQQTSLPVSPHMCSPSPIINHSIISANNSPKIRSRYNKRLKVPPHSLPPPTPALLPPPTGIPRNTSSSWSHCEFDAGDPNLVNSATSFPSASCNGSNFFSTRLRETRLKRSQYGSAGFSSSYCGGDDDYYNCSSSYYYGGGTGCSESMNCDYYRYQQNSSYYHNNGYSTYSNPHAGYANGYHYSKDHNERYNSMVSNGDMTCGMSQSCQMDKYHYNSAYNNEEHQPYHYNGDKQSSIPYHQYQPYMAHNQHQLPSQPSYNNYNGYNSYAPVSSFGYY